MNIGGPEIQVVSLVTVVMLMITVNAKTVAMRFTKDERAGDVNDQADNSNR